MPLRQQTPSGAEVITQDIPAAPDTTMPSTAPPISSSADPLPRYQLQQTQPQRPSSRPSSNPRRKFNDFLDLALLKEVQAANAHRPKHGSTLVCFATVAKKFNEANMITWKTDDKHCQNRFKLFIAKFRREDREKANASGGGETYGEFEQLEQDIVIEIDDFNGKKEAARMELQGKEEALLAACRNLRDMDKSRSSSRSHDRGDANDEEEESMDRRRKRRRISPRKTRQDMDRAILAVEKAEELRNEMAERQDV
ncbi:hypothetical protein BWQ96_04001 [Gracilariopsis chorda]|uniref:Uncharacterized protein n=1 Tax=Gracilariopsis chorda TaxID=448386 RepID=A0A2V3IVP4_9FLOR|nr:hypothetical protein BWQ96_04001 [Gracilariopsis chorda]|eukprot:PXF46216.1 hypothetical protein BWQ96_04001 [Gracilariopsis chorda]